MENSNPVRPLSRFRRVFLLHFKGLMTGRRGSEVDRLTTVEDVEDNPTTFVRLRRSTLHYITLHYITPFLALLIYGFNFSNILWFDHNPG